MKYDACIVGSGAGAGPIAYELCNNGFKVLILEKGPWFKTEHFSKDEMIASRRKIFTPDLRDECHVLVKKKKDQWNAKSTYKSGKSIWNGNMVGGSSNLMSGYFHRLKPMDFKLLSEFGPIEGANIADWPISYEDLEPYYAKTEKIIGVSGKVVSHSMQEPRSTPDFPYPPLAENVFSSWLEKGAKELGYELFPTPRAILSKPKEERSPCYYSNFCGSYPCSSDAKGSSRVALLDAALKTGNLTILPNSKVFELDSDGKGKIKSASYYDSAKQINHAQAKIFIVAAQAIETSRLLLMSKNDEFPNGISNNNGQVGKNLIFSSGGVGWGQFFHEDLSDEQFKLLSIPGLFINRACQQWYEYIDQEKGTRIKGGTIDFLSEHMNAVSRAIKQKKDSKGNLIYGTALKNKINAYFKEQRKFKFEIFTDWLPNDDCFVSLDKNQVDKWGDPVARVKLGAHEHSIKVSKFLAEKAEKLFKEIGMKNINSSINGNPSTNLQAGGCRFGNDPKTSVLDKNCRSHEVENLFITDGSFMPTGGSVPYTFTIYANSFRVADILIKELKTK